MKAKQMFNKARDAFYGKQAVLGTALMLSPLAVFASGTDPSTEITTQINQGKGWGVAAATAFVVAVWAITSVHMARRKG